MGRPACRRGDCILTMARMFPALFDDSNPSAAERRVFELLKYDPATTDWVVLHSLGLARRGKKPFGEVDFVVLVPRAGVACLEVKGGRVACRDGAWETTDRYDHVERLKRSPFIQARDGMFAVRDAILNRAPVGFPPWLVFASGVVMPDIEFSERSVEWEPWHVLDRRVTTRSMSSGITRLLTEQRTLHRDVPQGEPSPATVGTIRQLLRPDFEVVISRKATIEDSEAQLLRMTEEQFDALDMLADNERCLFEGAAGTGKTMLALEYAKRSSAAGHRTLLICFNRLLGDWLSRQVLEWPQDKRATAGRYFKLLRETILRSSIAPEFLETEGRVTGKQLYQDAYGLFGKLAVEEVNEAFDVLVLDEAQDLIQPEVLEVLNAWLRGGLADGRWAIFGDFQRQAIFGNRNGSELRSLLAAAAPQHTKGRLTLNCRNTRNIGEETALLSGFPSPPYRMGQLAGLPVDYRYYKALDQQREIVVADIRRLLAEGMAATDVVVLSNLRLQNSCLANLPTDATFRLEDIASIAGRRRGMPVIAFATAQSFKGMESSVVILCDVEGVSDAEPQALLYVAMSRARAQLIVVAHDRTKGSIAESVRRRLLAEWNTKS